MSKENINNVWTIKPVAVLCPVCNGSGAYNRPPGQGKTNANPQIGVCHGCGGKGWVTP